MKVPAIHLVSSALVLAVAAGPAASAEATTIADLTCKDYGALITCDNGETYRRQPRPMDVRARPENPALAQREKVHSAIRTAFENCIGLMPREGMNFPRPVQYARFPDFPACLERQGVSRLGDDDFALHTYRAMLGLTPPRPQAPAPDRR